MSTRQRSIATLEYEERLARHRLAVHRARLYRGRFSSPMAADQRLQHLLRVHEMALKRLHEAREERLTTRT